MSHNGYRFGTFGGVFVPALLSIFGAVMFMRLGFVVGGLGITGALIILLTAESIAIASGLSVALISTNTPVYGGGVYFLISRALGPNFGTAVGISLYLAQAMGIPFYILGFSEAIATIYPALAPHTMWLNLGPLAILVMLAFFGADWAIRVQYVVLTVLGLSIVAILLGAGLTISTQGSQWAANLPIPTTGTASFSDFAASFAIFFPAVTGFLAGVNMSGDLKDPQRSLPRGTLFAILTGLVVYALEMLFLGAAYPQKSLYLQPFNTMMQHAPFGLSILIALGMGAAMLSSALGMLLSAPRLIQAFAADKVLPHLQLFARGTGKNNEPAAALTLTTILAGAILAWAGMQPASNISSPYNPLNLIATVLAMFNLYAYTLVNLAALVESVGANPSFRPRFRFFHWSIALYGVITSVGAALLIAPFMAALSLCFLGFLFWLAQRQNMQHTFGDARRGFIFSRLTHLLRQLARLRPDAKNWRPQIVVLMGNIRRHGRVLECAGLLSARYGLLSVLEIMTEAELGSGTARQRELELRRIGAFAGRRKLNVYPSVVVLDDQDTALRVFLQSHGIGPLVPNTVMSGWPGKDRYPYFFHHLETIARLKMNSILLLNKRRIKLLETPTETIDVWFRGGKNSSLMLILAYLLTRNRQLRDLKIRLIRAVPPPLHASAGNELRRLLETARLEAEIVILDDSPDLVDVFRRTSSGAAFIFLGFEPPKEADFDRFHRQYEELAKDMPPIFLVNSSGETLLSA
ncbi:MAG: amino acid permease [Lentisphaeria bacterium]|nr:amino acid permease [Lentisphaeria bacterium]